MVIKQPQINYRYITYIKHSLQGYKSTGGRYRKNTNDAKNITGKIYNQEVKTNNMSSSCNHFYKQNSINSNKLSKFEKISKNDKLLNDIKR